jgi:short-subunit dehydrogenase
VAIAGYKGMQKGKLVIIPSFKYKIEVFGIRLLPPKTAARIIRKWQDSLKK